ncbi:MAG: molybdenum cofactor guanylyltransferase, partial [Pseudomonadota bacterium]
MTAPLGVILAGGQARRMGGGDKGLLQIGDRTLLDLAIERLSPQVDGLALNANGAPERFAAFELPVLPDPLPDYPGPLAGVLAGLEWADAHGATHIVTAAADTPFFPADLVPRLTLAAETEGKPIALSRTENGRHPTFVLERCWPKAEGRMPYVLGPRQRDWLSLCFSGQSQSGNKVGWKERSVSSSR